MKSFYNVTEKHDDELKLLGVSFKELGIYSTRKGVTNMVASGCTISLPITSLCIRIYERCEGALFKERNY